MPRKKRDYVPLYHGVQESMVRLCEMPESRSNLYDWEAEEMTNSTVDQEMRAPDGSPAERGER